jgi:hypothetical protein
MKDGADDEKDPLSVFPWVRIALDDRSLTKKKNGSNLKYTLLS